MKLPDTPIDDTNIPVPDGSFPLFAARNVRGLALVIGLTEAECLHNVAQRVIGGMWMPKAVLRKRYPIRPAYGIPLRDLTREERRLAEKTLPWCLEANRTDDTTDDIIGVDISHWQLCLQSAVFNGLHGKNAGVPTAAAFWPFRIVLQ